MRWLRKLFGGFGTPLAGGDGGPQLPKQQTLAWFSRLRYWFSLNLGSIDARKKAISSLARSDSPQAAQYLAVLLRDNDASVREAAVKAFAGLKNTSVMQLLTSALNSRLRHEREAAAKGLGKTGNPLAVKPLINALMDTERDVRHAAASALESIADGRRFLHLWRHLRISTPLSVGQQRPLWAQSGTRAPSNRWFRC